jgi:hypothetical protein
MPTNSKEYQKTYMKKYARKSEMIHCNVCNMDLQRHSMARHCRSQTHQELVQINPFDKLLQFQKKHKWDTIKLIVYGLKTFRETDKYYVQEEEDPYKSEEANEEEKEEQLDQVAPGVPEPLEVKHVHFLEPQAESCNCEIGDH